MPPTDKLGKYEIRRELGRGAMGVVYEAFDPQIKRVVALKTIRADQLAGEEAATILARFRREAQAAGKLSHPNIVPIYDFDEDGGTSFIAMEYVDGRDLRDLFGANERFAAADAFRIMDQILAALAYSHAQGVVHRDIKPGNIFVRSDGTVKVADFGIAHIESSSLTQAGSVIGTPGYMSPEQVLGLPVDGRSDLFSAGVILYQFLTGERPFAGSPTTVAQKVLKEEPLPPSTLNVLLPDAIDAVVRKALAKRPEERFQTAVAFAAALRAAAGHRLATGTAGIAPAPALSSDDATVVDAPETATVTRSATRAPAVEAPAVMPPPLTATVRPRSQSVAVGIAGAAIALAFGAALWLGLQWTKGRSSPAAPVDAAQAPALPEKQATPPAATLASTSSPASVAAPVASAPVADVAPSAPSPSAPPSPAPAPPAAPPGTLIITALGVADPADPRFAGDPARLQQGLRADANAQLVEKALGLMVDRASLASHYDLVQQRLLARSASFVGPVVRESGPRTGADGLVSMTTEAVVDVKAVQKSLDEMTRSERVTLIRSSGDPRIALRVRVQDADRPEAGTRASPVAENLLKARLQSFGFRTWSDGASEGSTSDFLVTGDAKVRRLTTRLQASGLTVTKYAVTALAVTAVDRATGEEIYHDVSVPKGTGSWATEEEALKAVGGAMADRFSRDFFVNRVHVSAQRVSMAVEGFPEGQADALTRELAGLPLVVSARPRAGAAPRTWDVELGGTGPASDRVVAAIVTPLNRKLGQSCFATGSVEGDAVRVTFDARCADPAILGRLETHPPAGLYGAPPGRTRDVIRNPDTLRKLAV